MRKIIFRVLLLVILAAAGFYLWSSGRLFSRKDTNRLPVSGNIELTQVDISFKVPGKLVELDVDEGAFVKKGQVIARIDRDQMESQRNRDEASVVASESQFQQIETGVRWQRATLESDIALKKAEVRAAQARLDLLLAGSRPQEIQQAQAAVADATAQRDQAKGDWDRSQTLFKNDDISKQQYDQARTSLRARRPCCARRRSGESLMKEGPRKEDIAAGARRRGTRESRGARPRRRTGWR